MTVAGFQHQPFHPFVARKRLDPLDAHGADLAAAMGRPGIHALDLADGAGMALQRATTDREAIVASYKHGCIFVGHLLDCHVVAMPGGVSSSRPIELQ
jgi:hypothetical protein